MYETVIWVALVAAVLSLVFEMIYRRVFTALAGSAVALLGTITAANVPLLDPSIKSLQPVLRSNLWLTIHVLDRGLQLCGLRPGVGLGLIATLYYLTATYRRSPRLLELWRCRSSPACRSCLAAASACWRSYGCFGPEWTTGDGLFYVFAVMALVGETLSLMSVLAICGELINRLTFRAEAEPMNPSDDGTG